MSENKHTEFDQMVKESFNDFNASYDQNDWSEIQSKMKGSNAGTTQNIWKVAAIGSLTILVGVLAFFGLRDDVSSTKLVKESTTTSQVTKNHNQKVTPQKVIQPEKRETKAEKPTPIKEVNQKHDEPVAKKQAIASLKPSPKNIDRQTKPVNKEVKQTRLNQTIGFVFSNDRVCQNEIISLKPNDSLPGASYLWDFGNGEASTRMKPKYKFDEAGNYYIQLKVRTQEGATLVSEKQMLVVNPKPKATFDYETTDFHCKNSSICFRSDVLDQVDYHWNFGDRKFSSEQNPKHTYYRKGHYNVKLRVTNDFGCKDSIFKQVYVMRAYNLLAPNTFSPNGDGNNDTWIPIALKTERKSFNLKVLNANGTVVFTSSQPDNNWNGDLQTGGRAKTGEVYFWIAVVEDENGTPNEYGGSIVISD